MLNGANNMDMGANNMGAISFDGMNGMHRGANDMRQAALNCRVMGYNTASTSPLQLHIMLIVMAVVLHYQLP
jgi:hypothetical protein